MSAHIRFLCPTCKAVMDAPVERAGNKINCLKCGQRLQIPPPERAKTVLAPSLGVDDDPQTPAASSPSNTGADIAAGPPATSPAKDKPAPLPASAESPSTPPVHDLITTLRQAALPFLAKDWRRLPTCVHLSFAFLLIFLPWVNMSCDGRHLASQSGLQTCYGGASLDQKLERVGNMDRPKKQDNPAGNNSDEAPPWSLLSIIYVLLVLAGLFFGLACVLSVFLKKSLLSAGTHLVSLGFGSLAFLVLTLQMIIHFPIERQFDKKLTENRKDREKHDERSKELADRERQLFKRQPGQFPLGNMEYQVWQQELTQNRKAIEQLGPPPQQIGPEIALIEFKYSFWLWLSCIVTFLSGPVFLLEAGIFIFSRVKDKRSVPSQSGYAGGSENDTS